MVNIATAIIIMQVRVIRQMITAQMLYYYATTSPLCYLTASDWDFSDSSTHCSEFKTTKCQMTPLHVHRLLQNKNYVTK